MEHKPLDAYLRDPLGYWTSGEGWLHACAASSKLSALVTWGDIGADQATDCVKCTVAALEKMPAHARLVDGRRTTIQPVVFRIAADYVIEHRALLRERVTRVALVRPLGWSGAMMAGFFSVVNPPYPTDVFDERGEALRALGCEEDVALLERLEELAPGQAAPSFVTTLRRAIEGALLEDNPETVANELELSVRGLQRRLKAHGTSFQRELTIVRVRVAQNMMLQSDAPIEAIAAEVGFSSPAAFSRAFLRCQGRTPREWREAYPS